MIPFNGGIKVGRRAVECFVWGAEEGDGTPSNLLCFWLLPENRFDTIGVAPFIDVV